MNRGGSGFDVTIYAWVSCTNTANTLMHLFHRTYTVQPPPWCLDDPTALHMQLEHLAKMKCLVELRQTNAAGLHHSLKDCQQYIIRATIAGWLTPPDHQGSRHEVKFHPFAEYL